MKKIVIAVVLLIAIGELARIEAQTHILKVSYITKASIFQVMRRDNRTVEDIDDEVEMRAGESANG